MTSAGSSRGSSAASTPRTSIRRSAGRGVVDGEGQGLGRPCSSGATVNVGLTRGASGTVGSVATSHSAQGSRPGSEARPQAHLVSPEARLVPAMDAGATGERQGRRADEDRDIGRACLRERRVARRRSADAEEGRLAPATGCQLVEDAARAITASGVLPRLRTTSMTMSRARSLAASAAALRLVSMSARRPARSAVACRGRA